MIYGMYLSTMGAMVQSSRHDNIANNIANVTTTGYKADRTVFRAIPAESELQGSMRQEIDQILEDTGGGVWLGETQTVFSPGPFRLTGNPLDVALDDSDVPGMRKFFMVRGRTEDDVLYTRDGHFSMSPEGILLHSSGAAVLSPDGQPIILPAGGTVHVNQDGTVFGADGDAVGQIGVVATLETADMRKIGDNLFRPQAGTPFDFAQTGVIAETLEGSAVEPVREMAAMIEAHRIYETNMRFITMQDQTLGATVNRLAQTA